MNEKIIPLKILKINFNLKSYIITLYFSIFIITQMSLEAKESSLAIVTNIYSNTIQKVKISNSPYLCKAHGVIGLNELLQISKKNSSCSKSIQNYYISHPKDKYFTDSIIKVGAMYHIILIDNTCILKAKGEVTLSELLLKNGFASLKKKFRNREYSDSFHRAQMRAKEKKIGIWSRDISISCLSQKYQLE